MKLYVGGWNMCQKLENCHLMTLTPGRIDRQVTLYFLISSKPCKNSCSNLVGFTSMPTSFIDWDLYTVFVYCSLNND